MTEDTVLIAHAVLGRSGHVEQDQLCLLGLLGDDLVEPHGGVHAPHVHRAPDPGHNGRKSQLLVIKRKGGVSR